MPINYHNLRIKTNKSITTEGYFQSNENAEEGQDYISLTSYGEWWRGKLSFTISGDEYDKFSFLAEFDTDVELELFLAEASISGQTVRWNDFDNLPQRSTVVNDSNLNFRNDGYGLGPSNYVDFLNSLFQYFNLKSVAKTHPEKTVIDYCKLDKFTFLFRENQTGFDIAYPEYSTTPNMGYMISSEVGYPWGLCDALHGPIGTEETKIPFMHSPYRQSWIPL